jgi:GntR family transcriptional regulator
VDFISIDVESSVPPSRQIVDAVLDAVAAGILRSGDRLPSVRDLAVQVMLNPNTIGKAYRELTWLGAVQSKAGSGVFVADDAPGIARERRRKETLIEFRRAAEHALRAGHQPERLTKMLDRISHLRSGTPAGEPS